MAITGAVNRALLWALGAYVLPPAGGDPLLYVALATPLVLLGFLRSQALRPKVLDRLGWPPRPQILGAGWQGTTLAQRARRAWACLSP